MIGAITQTLPKGKKTFTTIKQITQRPIVKTVAKEGKMIMDATWKSYAIAKLGAKTGMTLPEIMQYKDMVKMFSKEFSKRLTLYLKSFKGAKKAAG